MNVLVVQMVHTESEIREVVMEFVSQRLDQLMDNVSTRLELERVVCMIAVRLQHEQVPHVRAAGLSCLGSVGSRTFELLSWVQRSADLGQLVTDAISFQAEPALRRAAIELVTDWISVGAAEHVQAAGVELVDSCMAQ
eukprot:TRINITY_DN25575_c0_g2_i1.p1 TRINITY_DN25575_c0_g2~~TRINITY_DN25575_c0_g2_i1.p1  ORF type:complete len:138 (-),score=25.23 TRINITY_DN25575_c0_g2_i1:88-501(-)